LQRLRDEAHRFAVTYHRTLRGRENRRSALDEIPGIGSERKRRLLRAFGSVKRLREADVEALAAVPGISRALALQIQVALARPSAAQQAPVRRRLVAVPRPAGAPGTDGEGAEQS
jgi:excinuclease ABC subunit C